MCNYLYLFVRMGSDSSIECVELVLEYIVLQMIVRNYLAV